MPWNSGDSIQQLTLDAGRKEILEKKEGFSCQTGSKNHRLTMAVIHLGFFSQKSARKEKRVPGLRFCLF